MKDYIENDLIVVHADKNVFSKEALLKAMYWYGDRFHIEIKDLSDHFRICFQSIGDKKIEAKLLDDFLLKIRRDLVDFELRQIVRNETSLVQQLLVAKAFSNNSCKEDPPGSIADPVGFTIDE